MRFAAAAIGLGGWLLAAAPGGAPAPPAPELPRLTGIVIAGQHRVAIFESSPGVATAVEEGESIATYVVRVVGLDGVQVERDGRRFALALTGSTQAPTPVDTGGVTFGLVVNPQGPPDD
jgi:hypothetical protein